MKKIMMVITMIFSLGSLPAVSHAGWTASPSEPKSTSGEHESAKSGKTVLDYRASAVVGSWVKNKEGNYLGRITDLMIGPQDGGMAFAVLSHGGVLGIPMRFVAVPFHALTPSGEDHVYLLDVSKEMMAAAPSFKRDHWPDVASRKWEDDIYRYYGQTPQWEESYEPKAHTWRGANHRYDKIVGTSVKNQQREELGKISDLVIDSQGHVPLAILTRGGFWGMGGKLVAVPFSALNLGPRRKDYVLDTTQEKLDSAPAFKISNLSDKEWPSDVYRFFGQRPYWRGGKGAAEEVPMGGSSNGVDVKRKEMSSSSYPEGDVHDLN
jgi:sporulation protein YlmC with PRC-barrel domain